MRKEYFESQQEKQFVSLAKARVRKQRIEDWSHARIVKPYFLGTQVFIEYDLEKLLPYIDWDPFFQSW